jgi:hypothetical protein
MTFPAYFSLHEYFHIFTLYYTRKYVFLGSSMLYSSHNIYEVGYRGNASPWPTISVSNPRTPYNIVTVVGFCLDLRASFVLFTKFEFR